MQCTLKKCLRISLPMLCVFWANAAANAATGAGCFNYSAPITHGLARSENVHLPSAEDANGIRSAAGELPSGGFWAKVHGMVDRSIQAVLGELESHDRTKGGQINEMTVTPVADNSFLLRQKVKFVVRPFPFVSVDWDEDWAYTLLAGTAADPDRVLVAYEKIDGTSHIDHLCGNYLLSSPEEGSTDITLYEEMKATRRSQADELKGLKQTLIQLRAVRLGRV